MPSKVAEAYIEINAAAGNVGQQLDAIKGQVTGGVQGIVGASTGAIVGGIGAVAAIGGAMSGLLTGAVDAEADLARFNFTLDRMAEHTGFTTDQIRDMVTEFRSLGHASSGEIRGIMGTLLDFQSVGGEAFRMATEAAINFTRAGVDSQTAAYALGLALQNPAHGMRALRQLGVMFTHEQTQMIHAMMAAGDVAGAQGVIMAEVTRRSAGLAEAMQNTVSGQLHLLTRMAKEIGKGIGEFILPVMRPAISVAMSLIEMIKSGWASLPEPIQTVIRTVGTLAAVFVAIGAIVPVLGLLAGFFTPVIAAVTALLGPWGLLLAGIAVFGSALASLPDWSGYFDSIKEQVMIVWGVIKLVALQISTAFARAISGNSQMGLWDWLVDRARALRETVLGVVQAIGAWFERNSETIQRWGLKIGEVAGMVYNYFAGNWRMIYRVVTSVLEFIVQRVVSVYTTISEWVEENWDTFVEWGKIVRDIVIDVVNIMTELWEGFKSVALTVWEAVSSAFMVAWNAIASFFTETLGGMITDNIGTWTDIKNFITTTLEVIEVMLAEWRTALKFLWAAIKFGAIYAFETAVNFIADKLNLIVATAGGTASAITAAFRGMGTALISIASAIGGAFGAVFGSIGRAMRAILRGEFREAGDIIGSSVSTAVANARGQIMNAMGIQAAEARAAFDRGFGELRLDPNVAESEALQEARAQMNALGITLREALRRRRERRRQEGADDAELAREEEEAQAQARPRPETVLPAQLVTVEFKTASIADMWKQVQEAGDTKMEQLTQQVLQVQQQGNQDRRDGNRILEQVRDGMGGPARAG